MGRSGRQSVKQNGRSQRYEDVAAHLLNQIRELLKLEVIEGKQKLVGIDTGTEWQVDAKGVAEGNDGIVLIECRRYTTSKQNQEKLAGLAYRIQDTRAQGGIMVSPLGLQSGAQKVADTNNIKSIEIDANSTPDDFTMKFLSQLFVGGTPRINCTDEIMPTIQKKCEACGVLFEQQLDETVCPKCAIG